MLNRSIIILVVLLFATPYRPTISGGDNIVLGKVQNLTIQELFEHSDLVVIARVKRSKVTDRVVKDAEWMKDFLEVQTTFEVEKILKGKLEGKEFQISHYKEKPDTENLPRPALARFETIEEARQTRKEKNTNSKKAEYWDGNYMLFLKKIKSDVAFVTGNYESALSVRKLETQE